MKRFWGHLYAASFIACIGGMLLPACAHDDSSLYVVQIVVPPRADPTQGCLYVAPATNIPGLFSGVIDVGIAASYTPIAMIGNQLNARSDQLNIRTETNRVQLRGAVVRLTDSQGNPIPGTPGSFTSLTEGTVDPQIGTTPGLGLAAVTIIDPPTVAALQAKLTHRSDRKTVVSYFKVFGQTLGGTYIESAEFQYLVEACNGCLVDFPSDAIRHDPGDPPVNCLGSVTAAAATAAFALACTPGQDQPMDCRLCQGRPACDPNQLQ